MEPTLSPTHTVLSLDDCRQLVDEYLARHLDQCIADAETISPDYALLWRHTGSLLNAGGKRLRPYMTLLSYQAVSDHPIKKVIPAAAAMELLHLAMLVHDDIIDRDDVRYGVENITSRYRKEYANVLSDTAENQHFAESAALMAGDLLISEAYRLLTLADIPATAILQAQRLLAQTIFRVVGGELLDTEASFRTAPADPLLIATQKTASYSFVSPLLMGAILAEVSTEQHTLLETLGEKLGIAYQLRDDLLGVFGNEAVTGKSASGDLTEGKRTVLIQQFQTSATDAQRQQFFAVFGRHDADEHDVALMKRLIAESGAKDTVEQMITDLRREVDSLIDLLQANDAHKQRFKQLADMCLNRER